MPPRASQQTRDVIFRLVAENDNRNTRTLKKFGDEVAKIQQKMTRDQGDEGKKRLKSQDQELQQKSRSMEAARIRDQRREQQDARRRASMKAREAREDKRVERDKARAIAEQNKALDESRKKIQEGNRATTDGLLKAGEGAAQLAAGLTTVGLLSKANADQMLKTVVQIQAMNQLVKGSVELYRGLRDAIAGAAVAQAGLSASGAAGAAGGVAGAAGRAGGVRGAVTAGAAGAIAGRTGLGPAARLLGAGRAGLGFLAANPVGASVAALVGSGLVIGNVGGSRDFLEKQFSKDGLVGQGARAAGGFIANQLDNAEEGIRQMLPGASGPRARGGRIGRERRASERRARAAERRRLTTVTRRLRGNALADINVGTEAALIQNRAQQFQADDDLRGELQFNLRQQSRQRGRERGFDRDTAPRDRQMTSQIIVDLSQRENDIRKSILDKVRMEVDVRKRSNEEAIRGLETQLQLQRRLVQEGESRIQSATQRFGAKNPIEQQRILGLVRRLRAGDQNLREDELQSVDQFGLKSLGARTGAIRARRAAAGGVGELVAGEAAPLNQARSRVAQLEIKIEDRKQINVALDADVENLAQRIARMIEAKNDEIANRLQRLIRENQQRQQADLTRQNFEARAAQEIAQGS